MPLIRKRRKMRVTLRLINMHLNWHQGFSYETQLLNKLFSYTYFSIAYVAI